MDHEKLTDGERPGTNRAGPALTSRQAQILSIIERTIAETGTSASRSEIARAAGIRDVPSIEPALAALARQGLIELPRRAQRAIRMIDPGAAPVIRCTRAVDPVEPLVSDDRMVDRAPGTLVARLGEDVDYFLHMQDETLEPIGIKPGDLVAMRTTITILEGNIMAARDEEGRARWYRTTINGDCVVNCKRLDARRGEHSPPPTKLRTDGIVVGVVRIVARHRNSKMGSTCPAPTRKQGAVLDIMRRHVQLRGIPPSLGEIAQELQSGATNASVHAHVKGLEKKGLVTATKSKQRRWWPTRTGTVPIVDVEAWVHSSGKGGRHPGSERAPDTLAEPFQPRPDVFLTPNDDIAQRLGIETTDLIAVTAPGEVEERDLVIAQHRARGDIAFGEIHKEGDVRLVLRTAADNKSLSPIVLDTGTDGWVVAEIVTGTVRFDRMRADE